MSQLAYPACAWSARQMNPVADGRRSSSTRPLPHNHPVLDGIQREIRSSLQVELPHDRGFVKLRRFTDVPTAVAVSPSGFVLPSPIRVYRNQFDNAFLAGKRAALPLERYLAIGDQQRHEHREHAHGVPDSK
jgi:hypothetical protein